MTYAQPADVAALLARTLEPAEEALAQRRLDQVERLIKRRVPDLDDQITDGIIDQADVVDIEAEAVYRVMRNPEGFVSEGDGQYNYQRSPEAADGRLKLTAEEWLTLGIRPSKMFRISPGIRGVAL